MQIHKFGGASIASAERIESMVALVADRIPPGSVLVISALGKMTNALEGVANAFTNGQNAEALALFAEIKNQHLALAKHLLVQQYPAALAQLSDLFTEAEWLLHDKPVREAAYYYDQIVSVGELLSSTLVSFALAEKGVANKWLDIRDVLRTDNFFTEARIDWQHSRQAVKQQLMPLLQNSGLVVTQGFIGCTADNESTTLGREGSDFSAAVLANLLDAESQTIWKDVPSVMSADPKIFADAVPLPNLSYHEVIEMAYYGAQVIHPKTIKPLYEKKIPLYVKCFLDADLPGTSITAVKQVGLPPIWVKKTNQVMVTFRSKDYAFIGEHASSLLFPLFEKFRLRPNLTQLGAIELVAVFDDNTEKLQLLAAAAAEWLDVTVRHGLDLLTVRHFTAERVAALLQSAKVLVVQQTGDTYQALLESVADEN